MTLKIRVQGVQNSGPLLKNKTNRKGHNMPIHIKVQYADTPQIVAVHVK